MPESCLTTRCADGAYARRHERRNEQRGCCFLDLRKFMEIPRVSRHDDHRYSTVFEHEGVLKGPWLDLARRR